ncbi:MAG: Crp/Fnr family transcriptional regulator [Methylomonas sp.]|jgi:CRP-like cAMP-binding protein
MRPVFAANLLLASLPAEVREQLLARSETVELNFAEVLYKTGDRIPDIYFPTGGFISLVTPVDGGSGLEVGLIGNEGMLGLSLILGVETAPYLAVVQGAGSALRMTSAAFLQVLEENPVLRKLLKRYLYVSMRQLAQTAACYRIHVVEERLARWLLMTQDRAHANSFHITHIFLAYMLGVRRVGITKAASSLQRQKLISYRRGNITILDRAGLEKVSCGCYQVEKQTYDTIMAHSASFEKEQTFAIANVIE